MSHLEALIAEYLDIRGFVVRRNLKVGRLAHGGWQMELDVVGYSPDDKTIEHYEPSVDANNWATREARYLKKFENGRQYILEHVFPWVPKNTQLRQFAVFPSRSKDRITIAGGTVLTIDELMATIRTYVLARGPMCRNAIPEQYPLLRTLQLNCSGYVRLVESNSAEAKG